MLSNPFADGPVYLDTSPLSLGQLPANLKSFVQQSLSYRSNYLQSKFNVAFDGYSFDGQTDSINQGPDDPLHSFVLSDFSELQRFPDQFQSFLQHAWPQIKQWVARYERDLLTQIDQQATGEHQLLAQYDQQFGHMLSANYYPAQATRQQPAPKHRLSEHPDVSLMTVFPFGVDACFEYQHPATGQWQTVEPNKPFVFAGHLLEYLTDGHIKPLNHRVRYASTDSERFSFALFSLPYPTVTMTSRLGTAITAQAYFKAHLSLWD